jgi:purine-binding chemotaxis protein CheW
MAEDLHLVTFRVGKELFGVPIAAVQEIVRVPAIVNIPQSPKFVEGVINLRGRIITVIDMNKRLGHKAADDTSSHNPDSRILVVEVEGRLVGIIVDSVAEVIRLSRELVDSAPAHID